MVAQSIDISNSANRSNINTIIENDSLSHISEKIIGLLSVKSHVTLREVSRAFHYNVEKPKFKGMC